MYDLTILEGNAALATVQFRDATGAPVDPADGAAELVDEDSGAATAVALEPAGGVGQYAATVDRSLLPVGSYALLVTASSPCEIASRVRILVVPQVPDV